jgi:signal transduction histidine kinase
MATGTPDTTIRVLLVDDDEEDYLLTLGYLKDIAGRNYHLDWVHDYDSALEKICESQHDVYLIDYRLGARDGLTLIQDALARGCMEPMILLTGQGQFETDLAAMKVGAADYLEKSNLDPVRLERTIRYACLQKRMESELEAKVHARTLELEKEIEARRRVEEQLRESNRRKDEFLAMLGHELRNPLMPIVNALGILQMGPAQPPPVQKALDLLDVSRITNGRLRLDREPIRLLDILSTALEVSQLLLDKGQITLEVNTAPDLPEILGDRVRLAQVFMNLLNNASRYTPAGGKIIVTMSQEERTPGHSSVAIHFKDTGVGIAPEALPMVFDLFAQDDDGVDRARDGLGVGLALVRGLVELHGGTVTVHSDGIGKGTEFVVCLPVPEKGS